MTQQVRKRHSVLSERSHWYLAVELWKAAIIVNKQTFKLMIFSTERLYMYFLQLVVSTLSKEVDIQEDGYEYKADSMRNAQKRTGPLALWDLTILR